MAYQNQLSLSARALREVLFPLGLPLWEDKNKPAGAHLPGQKGRVCFSAKKGQAEFIDGTRAVAALP